MAEENNETKVEELLYSNNFYTCYSCYCEYPKIDFDSNGCACFKDVFDRVKNDVEYKIRICYDPAILLKNKSNYCPLEKNQIEQWLDYVCSISGGKYEIGDCTLLVKKHANDVPMKYPCHEVHFWLNNESNIMHKFALTAIRFLYEYSYNVFLKDVFRLKCIEEFKDETLLNLFNMIHESCKYYKSTWGSGHSFSGCAKLMDDDTLKKKIVESNRLNDIYPSTRYFNELHVFEPSNLLDYWEDDDEFENTRLPIYIYNYKLLCNERNEEIK